MADIKQIEYRVVPANRWIVTRFYSGTEGNSGVETKGEYTNEQLAHEVAYALCRDEHQRLGFPVGDERIQYPKPIGHLNKKASGTTHE